MAQRVLMKGNEAIAEAAIRAGCRHYFGYPITPQTEIAAYMAKKMPKIGGVFLQAESEIASINMVYGAAATGCRVMTSSSSPGISLKAEASAISPAPTCLLWWSTSSAAAPAWAASSPASPTISRLPRVAVTVTII